MLANLVSGKMVDLKNLKFEDIDLVDISVGLSNQCRYNGQVVKFYSVAEHCVLLVRYAQSKGYNEAFQKALLLHDAAEAYIGDVIRNVKKDLKVFNDLETSIINKIFIRYGVVFSPCDPKLMTMDTIICKDEMRQLQRVLDEELSLWVLSKPQLGIKVQGWSPEEAIKQFLFECERLGVK